MTGAVTLYAWTYTGVDGAEHIVVVPDITGRRSLVTTDRTAAMNDVTSADAFARRNGFAVQLTSFVRNSGAMIAIEPKP